MIWEFQFSYNPLYCFQSHPLSINVILDSYCFCGKTALPHTASLIISLLFQNFPPYNVYNLTTAGSVWLALEQ